MFLGFVGGGRRGQESWVALKLTVCSVAAAIVVAGGIAVCCAVELCFCAAWLTGAAPLSSCLPPCLSGESILSSYPYFVRADAVLLHG